MPYIWPTQEHKGLIPPELLSTEPRVSSGHHWVWPQNKAENPPKDPDAELHPLNQLHSLPAGAGTAAIHPLPSMRHIPPDRNPQDHTRACLCLFLRTQPEEETGRAVLGAEASVPTADPLGPSQEAPCPAPVLRLPNGQEVLHVPESNMSSPTLKPCHRCPYQEDKALHTWSPTTSSPRCSRITS